MLKTYIIDFKSISSPIRAYTLFGAICWAYRLAYSEEELIKFLKQFKDYPKFLISSPFPIVKGYICEDNSKTLEEYYLFPKPILPLQKKFAENQADVCKKIERKSYKKAKFITEDVLKDFLNGKITEEKQLIENFEYKVYDKSIIYKADEEIKFKTSSKSDLLTKNIINRITNTSDNLFTEECFYYDRQFFLVKFFDEDFIKKFNDTLKIIELLGLGKNKNIGWGKISITEDTQGKLNWLNEYIDNSNRFVTLSPIIPKSSIDLKNSFYEFEIYKSPIENSFSKYILKQKVLYLKEGSVISSKTQDYKGQLKKVVKDYEIYQYGLEFPLKVQP
jgi:CRISPR-associated protein Csm4